MGEGDEGSLDRERVYMRKLKALMGYYKQTLTIKTRTQGRLRIEDSIGPPRWHGPPYKGPNQPAIAVELAVLGTKPRGMHVVTGSGRASINSCVETLDVLMLTRHALFFDEEALL